jgi:deazaflavin-dependent oxidoreductase (nitroreductase family)
MKMEKQNLSLFVRFILRVEEIIMTRLVPKDNPGPIFKWLFKTPIFFYRIGLPIFSNFFLLMTTTGRKSGKQHYTPLEYQYEKGTGYPIIMAGWGGKTDWSHNVAANPRVHVQIGHESFDAIAEPYTDAEVSTRLIDAMRINPSSARIWSRWAGESVTLEDPSSVEKATKFFPCFRLIPLIDNGESDQSA